MRPHGLDAEFAADDPKGLGQLRADVSPAGPRPAEEEREVLGADDRAPGSGDSTEDMARVDADGDGRVRRAGSGGDRRRERASLRLDGRHARDGVPRLRARRARRVEVRAVRDREDVAAALVDGLERTVGRRAPVDEVAGRARDRRPIDRDLAAPAHGPNVLRRRERDRRRRSVAFGLGAERREPGDPRGAGRRPGLRPASRAARSRAATRPIGRRDGVSASARWATGSS